MRGSFHLLMAMAVVVAATTALAGGHSEQKPDGAAIYEANCANCHSGGFGGFFTGAPKVGKAADWEPLIAKGVDTLTANTLSGVGKMAARGECQTCSDEDIRAAVEHMVEQSR